MRRPILAGIVRVSVGWLGFRVPWGYKVLSQREYADFVDYLLIGPGLPVHEEMGDVPYVRMVSNRRTWYRPRFEVVEDPEDAKEVWYTKG